ncbi:RsbRD N-terminal domain-containing protein [Methylobacillus glycogenes]|uniref:RsbRD N-terminal domain-containing protein n=1 Tax=Methylobacillus glycogenes TaxID=406 RepID=UPI0019003EA0|nr:RsbRD N-terminal domain-containing protein [Methylobacillus glycogenes]
MSTETKSHLTTAVVTNQAALLEGWLSTLASLQTRRDKGSEAEIRQQASLFLNLLPKALASGDLDINKPAWDEIKQLLSEISKSRASQGISPIDTALFIFSLKEPLFSYLQTSISNDPLALVHETTAASILFDKLGLYTVEAYQKTRESIIQRQQQELLELSTPWCNSGKTFWPCH